MQRQVLLSARLPCAFSTCLPGSAAFRSTAYPNSSTSKLSPSLLLGFAALRVMVSLISCTGFFILKAHQICSLDRMMKSLLLSWGKLLLICVCNRKKAFFPNSNIVTAFQTHFAAQNDHYAQQGSSSNSLPVSCGQIIWVFYMKVCTVLPSREKNDTHTPTKLLKGRALLSFYCQT